MPAKASEKIDLFKLHKEEYAQPKKPKIITVSRAQYLAIDGMGDPAGDVFQDSIGGLYLMAYTLKFAGKAAGRDFGVCKLEAIWRFEEASKPISEIPKSDWRWTMMIRVPEFIADADLAAARDALRDKGKEGDFDAVGLRELEEGECVQMLHVGPYEQEPETIAIMAEYMADNGLRPAGNHHEVYLSDPRRVPPERLRTILRQPVSPAV